MKEPLEKSKKEILKKLTNRFNSLNNTEINNLKSFFNFLKNGTNLDLSIETIHDLLEKLKMDISELNQIIPLDKFFEKKRDEINSKSVNEPELKLKKALNKHNNNIRTLTTNENIDTTDAELKRKKIDIEKNKSNKIGSRTVLNQLRKALKEKKRSKEITNSDNPELSKILEELNSISQTGGASNITNKKPQLNQPTMFNPLNCNQFDGSCCPQDATGFGTILNEEVTLTYPGSNK